MGTQDARFAAIAAWLPEFRQALGDVVDGLGGTRKAGAVVHTSHTHLADMIRGDAIPSAATLQKLIAAWGDRIPPLAPGAEHALARYSRQSRKAATPQQPIPIEGLPDGAANCVDALMRQRGAAYALCVAGNWLRPHISRGDVVWVQITPVAEDGDAVICRPVDGINLEVRAVRAHAHGATLETLRPESPPVGYGEMTVIGRVVGHMRPGNPGIQIPKPPIITA